MTPAGGASRSFMPPNTRSSAEEGYLSAIEFGDSSCSVFYLLRELAV